MSGALDGVAAAVDDEDDDDDAAAIFPMGPSTLEGRKRTGSLTMPPAERVDRNDESSEHREGLDGAAAASET
jgi:hypothetical protein